MPFDLPLDTPDLSEEVSDGQDSGEYQGVGRILVAEDYPTNQQVVRLHMESAGHEVTIVDDGLQAVAACESQEFDMIFMDVQMPNLDGNSAIRQIRAGESACKDIPIISLTAHADAESHRQCMDAGANEVVTKPVRRNILLGCISKWLKVSSDGSRQVDGGELKSEELEVPFDFETAVEEFGSAETISQIACQFLLNVDEQIEQIRQAIACEDMEAIRSNAHSVKGGAATLEAHPLSRVAKELERLSKTGEQEMIPEIFDKFIDEYSRLKDYVDDKVRSQ